MLEKSLSYSHQLNIRFLNNEPNSQRSLAKNEYYETNITQDQKDEILEIEFKTNHAGGGNFLLYFQGKFFFFFFLFYSVNKHTINNCSFLSSINNKQNKTKKEEKWLEYIMSLFL